MGSRFEDMNSLRNSYFEIFSSLIFLLGTILYLRDIESAKYVLIVGASFLSATYVLMSLSKGRTEKAKSSTEIYIDRLVLDILAMIVMGSMLKMIGSLDYPLIEAGLVAIAICLLIMVFNKIKFKSTFGWNLVYFLRILSISCLGLYLIA